MPRPPKAGETYMAVIKLKGPVSPAAYRRFRSAAKAASKGSGRPKETWRRVKAKRSARRRRRRR